MKHYTCDVCNNAMPPGYERGGKKSDRLTALCKLEDVCPECAQIGHELPVEAILLDRWRQLVLAPASRPAQKQEEPETPVLRAKECEGFSGRGGAEKAAIHKRLVAFRGSPPRLGCLNDLAAATKGKVTADELRQILVDGMSPSIDVWRIIDKALDKLENETNKTS